MGFVAEAIMGKIDKKEDTQQDRAYSLSEIVEASHLGLLDQKMAADHLRQRIAELKIVIKKQVDITKGTDNDNLTKIKAKAELNLFRELESSFKFSLQVLNALRLNGPLHLIPQSWRQKAVLGFEKSLYATSQEIEDYEKSRFEIELYQDKLSQFSRPGHYELPDLPKLSGISPFKREYDVDIFHTHVRYIFKDENRDNDPHDPPSYLDSAASVISRIGEKNAFLGNIENKL